MKHIFITGLPRSGTTLTRWIFQYSGYPVTNELHLHKELIRHISGIKEFAEKAFDRQRWRHQDGEIDTGERIDNIIRSVYESFSDIQIYNPQEGSNVFINKTPNLDFKEIDTLFSSRPKYIVCIRHPISNIHSMCNSNFGKKYEKVSEITEKIFNKSFNKTVDFYSKISKVDQDRIFYLKTDSMGDYNNRVDIVNKMFKFLELDMVMDTKFPYHYKGFSGDLRKFLKEWPNVNSGDVNSYQSFTDENRHFLLGSDEINSICNKFGYNKDII